jgi:hypothetical protein
MLDSPRSTNLLALAAVLMGGAFACNQALGIEAAQLDPGTGGNGLGGAGAGFSGGVGGTAAEGLGGTTCTPPASANACGVCLNTQCCAELTACNLSDDCVNLADCVADCEDDACFNNCEDTFPVGVPLLVDFLDCGEANCTDECSDTGTGGTGGGTGGGAATCSDVSDRLDECGLTINDCDDSTEQAQCELECLFAATCEDLQAMADGELLLSSSLAQCHIECGPHFACVDGSLLIPDDLVCNGTSNCSDDSDELQCDGETWVRCDCTCTCTSCTTSGIRSCRDAASSGCSSCDAVCTEWCAEDAECGSMASSTGSCAPSDVPTSWACETASYDADDGCQCGCGAVDPDCASASSADCTECDMEASCATSCDDIDPTNNATCVGVPAEWTCTPAYYGGDDGCDCGCGAQDADCASSSSDDCDYCRMTGSCAASCDDIDPTNNATCS